MNCPVSPSKVSEKPKAEPTLSVSAVWFLYPRPCLNMPTLCPAWQRNSLYCLSQGGSVCALKLLESLQIAASSRAGHCVEHREVLSPGWISSWRHSSELPSLPTAGPGSYGGGVAGWALTPVSHAGATADTEKRLVRRPGKQTGPSPHCSRRLQALPSHFLWFLFPYWSPGPRGMWVSQADAGWRATVERRAENMIPSVPQLAERAGAGWTGEGKRHTCGGNHILPWKMPPVQHDIRFLLLHSPKYSL